MRLLLDTHVVFWWFIDEAQLSSAAHAAIKDRGNEVFTSIASAWEMAIKSGSGKWPEARSMVEDFEGLMSAEGFRPLPISFDRVRTAGLFQFAHRDPFDRLLAAQAQIEGLTLVSADPKVQALGAPWLW